MAGVMLLGSIVVCKDSDPMVSVLDCTSSSLGLSQWLRSPRYVLGQDINVSLQYFSSPRGTNRYWVNLRSLKTVSRTFDGS